MPDSTFPRGSEADSREELSVNSSNHSARSRNNGCRRTVSSPSSLLMFLVCAGSRDGLARTVVLVLSLLVNAGCNVGITAFCGTDVGDVGVAELEEPVNKPRTTIGTQFSVLHFIRLPSLMSCGF